MIEAYCLDNLGVHVVKKREPWKLLPTAFNYPKKPFSTAATYKKWACQQGTRYCAFSLVEGEVSTQRVSASNEPKRVLGMVADYDTDTPFTDKEVQEFVARSLASDHPCSYFSRSFRGGLHVVWFFEEPVSCLGKRSAQQFLREVSKGLGLRKLMRGYDEACADKPEQYYLYGRDWQTVSTHVVPNAVTHLWMHQSTSSESFKDYGTVVPLDRVFEEVQKKFPQHGWPGEFKEGSRGPTFFDPHGGHQSANSAVVRDTGMQAFNMEKGFYAWAEIFGPGFIKKFQTSRIGEAINAYYYDGNKYFEKLSNGQVVARSRKDVEVRLKTSHGLSSKTPKGGTSSEVEDAYNTIISEKLVHGAVPFVYDKRLVVPFQGRNYLNTAGRKPVEPSPDAQQWCDNFPFMGALLESVLGDEQLPYWLAWASRFLTSAHSGVPTQGHAMFLIGDTGVGKTLINENVLDILFGGHAACGPFLMGEDGGFNSHLFDFGLWTCDDRVPASDFKKFQHYTSTVKSIVANGVFTINEKFMKAGQLIWNGRLSVTANFTAEDIRMIPELNTSMRDKVMLFRAARHGLQFGSRQENRATCEREAPFLARFLLDYIPPLEIQSSNRFGVDSYIHKGLEEFSMDNGTHAYLLELVEVFNDKTFSKDGVPHWRGTSTELLQELGSMEGSGHFLKGVDVMRLGRSLAHFNNKGVDWLSKAYRTWEIKNPFI